MYNGPPTDPSLSAQRAWYPLYTTSGGSRTCYKEGTIQSCYSVSLYDIINQIFPTKKNHVFNFFLHVTKIQKKRSPLITVFFIVLLRLPICKLGNRISYKNVSFNRYTCNVTLFTDLYCCYYFFFKYNGDNGSAIYRYVLYLIICYAPYKYLTSPVNHPRRYI